MAEAEGAIMEEVIENKVKSGVSACAILHFLRRRRVGLCEFQASLRYRTFPGQPGLLHVKAVSQKKKNLAG